MRKLKITKSVSNENEESQERIREFEPIHESWALAESQFEQRTGLKEGAKVRYNGIDDKKTHALSQKYSDPVNLLNTDTIYEIEYIEIHRSFTVVKLVGFREEEFLGNIFTAVDKTEAKKCLKVGDTVRYIGKNNKHNLCGCSNAHDFLDYEGIYEVNSIKTNFGYIGLYALKLVGFEEELFNRLLFEKVTTSK